MNGVHDMGGMHGMGPIQYERTSRYSTSPGRPGYSHSTARWGPGANGPSMPFATRTSSFRRPNICA